MQSKNKKPPNRPGLGALCISPPVKPIWFNSCARVQLRAKSLLGELLPIFTSRVWPSTCSNTQFGGIGWFVGQQEAVISKGRKTKDPLADPCRDLVKNRKFLGKKTFIEMSVLRGCFLTNSDPPTV